MAPNLQHVRYAFMGRGMKSVVGLVRSPKGRIWGLSLALIALAGIAGAMGVGFASEARRDPGPYVPTGLPSPKRPLATAPAPPPEDLQSELQSLTAGYGEPVGLAVVDVQAGWTVQVAGDVDFPQQSVSKLWTAITLLDGVDQGRFRLDAPVTMRTEDLSVFFQPIAQSYGPDGYATTVEDLLRRAMIESDNAAADRLVRYVGGAGAIQATLDRKRLTGVYAGGEERDLQSAIAGMTWRQSYGLANNFKVARAQLSPEVRDQALAAYLENPPDRATPAGVAQALAALKRGEVLSPGATALLISLMGEAITGPRRLKGGLPPDWTLAHKTGTGQDWRGASVGINDVGLLTAPDGRTYAVAVMIRRTAQPVPARLAFMQGVSAAIVRHWQADAGTFGLSPDLRVAAGLPELGPLRRAR